MAATGQLFISYSRSDADWLTRFRKALDPWFPDGVTAWDDTNIAVGAEWFKEISDALDRAAAAVLLLSHDFLSSRFIMEIEWPRLKKAAAERGLIIIPLAIRASSVQATEISRYQAIVDPAQPISLLPAAEQDAALARVAEKIHDRLIVARRRTSGAGLAELRSFDVMPDVVVCASDDRGRIWATNGEEVKVLPLYQERLAHWALPKRRWKTFLDGVWRGGLVMSDWDGSIYRVDENHRDGVFRRGDPDALPFHLLAAGPEEELVGAAWDGSVRRWNAEGASTAPPYTVPFLPKQLVPLCNGEVLMVDPSERVHLFDGAGAETWSWQCDAPLDAVWLDERRGHRALIAIAGGNRLLRVEQGTNATQEQRLGASLVDFSRRRVDGDEWVVAAEEGGAIEWLSLSPLQLIRGSSVTLRWPLRQIVAMDTPVPSAVGVTDDGGLVLVRERAVQRFENIKAVQRLLLAGGGRFLLLLSDRRIGLYRNPALPAVSCRMAIGGINGALAVGQRRRLTVTVKNSGAIPIHQLQAVVHADGIIDATENDRDVAFPVLPGGEATLSFSLLARVAGEVTLMLRLILGDEGGPQGPPQEIPFYAESR